MNKPGLSVEKPTSEQLIAVNEKWELIPELVNRTRAHLEGILHASEHIWIYNSDAQILLQKRAPGKTFENMLDISAAWHTNWTWTKAELDVSLKSKTSRDAIRTESALRELHEELSISPNESFERVGEYRIAKSLQKNGAIHMNAEHDALYIMSYNASFHEIQFDPKEVAALQSVHLSNLESDLMKSSEYEFDLVTRDPHYYLPIFRAIRARLGLPKNEAFEDFVSRTPTEKPDFEPIILPTSSTNSSETNS